MLPESEKRRIRDQEKAEQLRQSIVKRTNRLIATDGRLSIKQAEEQATKDVDRGIDLIPLKGLETSNRAAYRPVEERKRELQRQGLSEEDATRQAVLEEPHGEPDPRNETRRNRDPDILGASIDELRDLHKNPREYGSKSSSRARRKSPKKARARVGRPPLVEGGFGPTLSARLSPENARDLKRCKKSKFTLRHFLEFLVKTREFKAGRLVEWEKGLEEWSHRNASKMASEKTLAIKHDLAIRSEPYRSRILKKIVSTVKRRGARKFIRINHKMDESCCKSESWRITLAKLAGMIAKELPSLGQDDLVTRVTGHGFGGRTSNFIGAKAVQVDERIPGVLQTQLGLPFPPVNITAVSCMAIELYRWYWKAFGFGENFAMTGSTPKECDELKLLVDALSISDQLEIITLDHSELNGFHRNQHGKNRIVSGLILPTADHQKRLEAHRSRLEQLRSKAS